ncbi:YczE/YyaS/YitT family protein [Bacillus marinisedimentorum]|uniref:YczE/YyaS/YitT family protein n=1 Tax=Bacillus marinisedimentorum TaxID=1821260 RepID=UPI0007DE5D65|nr:YitT family protein [Bacillus marinisedimentorum]
MTPKEKVVRWTFFTVGLIVLALGISMTIQAKNLGIGPWDVFHYGLFLQLGLTIGSWAIISGLVIIASVSIAQRSIPQAGTILNMLLIGIFIDLFNFILTEPATLPGQIAIFIAGTVVLGYGIGIYVSADLGAGPRDSLMLVVSEKTGWNMSWVRNGMEVAVLILGLMLGGPVGAGTVLIAFLLGPIVGFSLPQSRELLKFVLERGKDDENFHEGAVRPDDYDGTRQKVR